VVMAVDNARSLTAPALAHYDRAHRVFRSEGTGESSLGTQRLP
jgi:hypothetical protein